MKNQKKYTLQQKHLSYLTLTILAYYFIYYSAYPYLNLGKYGFPAFSLSHLMFALAFINAISGYIVWRDKEVHTATPFYGSVLLPTQRDPFKVKVFFIAQILVTLALLYLGILFYPEKF